MNEPAQRIRDYLFQNQVHLVDLIRDLVLVESPTTDPDSQKEIFHILSEVLEEADFRPTVLQGTTSGGILLAHPRNHPAELKQLVIGHSDTVWPLGTLKRMPLVVDNGSIAGPGVYDMKASLAMMVFAVRALHDLQLSPQVAPLVCVNSDEETGSTDSESQIRSLASQCNRAFILEPSLGPEGRLKTRRKGVGEFLLKVQGRASHAGLSPGEGASAIHELAHLIHKLIALNNPERGITVNVGTVSGGIRCNVVAAEADARVDVRVMTQADALHMKETIHNLTTEIPGTRLEVQGGFSKPPMEATPRNRSLFREAVEVGRELGLELGEGLSGGASDGNTTSLFTATLDGLGPVGDGAHAYHEFVYLDRLVERATLLSLLLLRPPSKE